MVIKIRSEGYCAFITLFVKSRKRKVDSFHCIVGFVIDFYHTVCKRRKEKEAMVKERDSMV